MLLTTRMKYNRPSGVRHIQLGGLDMAEGKELFMRIAGDNERLNEEKTQNAIHNLARKKRRSPSFAYNFS